MSDGDRSDEAIRAMLERRAGRQVPDGLLERSLAGLGSAPDRRVRPSGSRAVPARVRTALGALALLLTGVVVGAVVARPLIDRASTPATPQPAADVTASPAPDATMSPPPASPAPTNRPAPTALGPDTLAVVTRKGTRLRVRTAPTVDNRVSEKLDPLLKRRTELFVVGGPVRADPYDWYEVQPAYDSGGPYGWVAAGRNGVAWIRLRVPDCPPEPDGAALAALTEFEFLSCYGAREVTIVADIGDVPRPYEGGPCALAPQHGDCVEAPAWLLSDALGLLVDLDARSGELKMLGLYITPEAATSFAGVDVTRPMSITGSLDAPEAADCRLTDAAGQDLVPVEQAILRCRTRFVVREVRQYVP